MKNESITEFNWSFPKWVIIKNISKVSNRNNMCLSDLSREINIKRENPYFSEVLSYLIDMGAIIEKDIVGKSKMIEIRHKRLWEILENCEIWRHIDEHIVNKNKFWSIYKY